jgi:hypothetical protein
MKPKRFASKWLLRSLLPVLLMGGALCVLILVAMLLQVIGPVVLIGLLVALVVASLWFGWIPRPTRNDQ